MASSTTKPATSIISKSSVKPVSLSEESKKPYYLTPCDLQSLDFEYIEFGLLFNKPDEDRPMHIILDQLKSSLATTLTHFFPLSGRFVTQTTPSYSVYVDCKDPAGADFIHAVASNVTASDILTSTDIPWDLIKSLFALPPGTINSHGHTIPLLSVQVTQLVDSIFIAFSINHAIVDGTSAWHFINSFSQVCRNCVISRPPVTSRFLNDQVHDIPDSHNDQVHDIPDSHQTDQAPAPAYRYRVFQFSSKAISNLKTKSNDECANQKITSYKALAALIWRSVTRARGLRGDQLATCAVPINSRSKQEPPLSDDYFGNCIMTAFVSSTVDELLSNNLGWAAWKLHTQIISSDNFKQLTAADWSMIAGDPGLLFLGSSHWFDVYGNNFGWGNPIAARWSGEMVDGHVHILPGPDKGSVDVMMSLSSKFMDALELDDEFKASTPRIIKNPSK